MRPFRFPKLRAHLALLGVVGAVGLGQSVLLACSSHSGSQPGKPPVEPPGGPPTTRTPGQTTYQSAPMLGQVNYARGGSAGGDDAGTAAAPGTSTGGSTGTTRTVQETDIYRVDGNRLYYLNSYRGLMVFDVSNPDKPTLLGRSAIFGYPQEMFVQNGLAVVVMADWYGTDDQGNPFYGSVVRGLDASDPTNIKPVGDVRVPGWVQDTRVVGTVLYAVTEDYGWEYGWYGSGTAQAKPPTVAIASVSFANGAVTQAGYQSFASQYGGVFNVTPNAIMLASSADSGNGTPNNGLATTTLQYVDITDPGGAIKLRGSIAVQGGISGWGPDNGRWNLDFADGATAHTIGCADQWCGSPTDSYTLATVDFSNPDAPAIKSQFPIANLGWSAAARFVGTKLYLSPYGYYGYTPPLDVDGGTDGGDGGNPHANQTPFSIYDLSNAAAPALAGSTYINGSVWMYLPDGARLFALGNTNAGYMGGTNQVAVQYLDVSNAASPSVLSTLAFGGASWAWSPAQDTFKAFTIDDTKGLALVPFSGWDYTGQTYQDGVELIQYTQSGITGSGTAHTKGWVQRGIFVNGRLFALSDQTLASIDYTDPTNPRVVNELTLARNVVSAQPQGTTIAELSSDWWGNDTTTSEMRVLPIANADETSDAQQAPSASLAGVDAQPFQNGTLTYVVTQVQHQVPCPQPYGNPIGTCPAWTQEVQVVDTSNGAAKVRGTILLPDSPVGWYGGGWWGYWYYDWYDGASVVQVGSDVLAFRRWNPTYAYDADAGSYQYETNLDALYVVDLSNPDAPQIASTTITDDTQSWWGAMQAVGSTLYTTHYEWVTAPASGALAGTTYYVKYYLDQIDLTDRAHPKIGSKINVPGILVGGSSSDPSLLYTIDYNWSSDGHATDSFDVVKIDGGLAYLQSTTTLDGWVGNVFVQNDKAYMTATQYDWAQAPGGTYTPPFTELHQLDLSNPTQPIDRVTTDKAKGWGWLLGLAGDRALVTSGWGGVGLDVYKLSDTAAPAYEQSVRMNGWYSGLVSRQGSSLFLPTGYWGVQTITLQ